jgi:hypothetical protein
MGMSRWLRRRLTPDDELGSVALLTLPAILTLEPN